MWPKPRGPTGETTPSDVNLDSALINAELISQNMDRHAIGVALDQVLHTGWVEAPADPSRGSSFGRFGPRWDHFKEVPETFSLVVCPERRVMVT